MTEPMIPILRVELQRATHAIMVGIENELLKLDEDIRVAIEEACKPEAVRKMVRKAVDETLKHTIEREIDQYFRYNAEGQQIIKKAIAKRLSEQVFD